MASHLITTLPLVAAGVFLAVPWFGLRAPEGPYQNQSGAPAIRAGKPMPEISVLDPAGQTVSLGALLQGRHAVIAIVQPDCPHCHAQLEVLAALWEKRTDVQRIGLLVVSLGDSSRTRWLTHEFPGITIYRDAELVLVREHRLASVPVLVLVDAEGTIRYVATGWSDGPAVRALVQRFQRDAI